MDGIDFVRFKVDNPELAHLRAAQKSGTMMHPCPCASTAHTPVKCRFSTYFIRLLLMSSFRKIARNPFPRVLNFKRSVHDFSSRLHSAHGTFSFGYIDPDTEHGYSFFPDKILQCFRTGLLRFKLVRDAHAA